VIPLSLGIETLGGVNTKLIEKNTTVPSSKKQIFSTAADSQPSVEIHILQGERDMSADSKTLGRFMLDGIPPAPRGVPQVEVSFDVDANGILNVKAQDKATGKEQKITITASSGLSDEEVDKMKEDAKKHAAEDKKKREAVEVKNNADTIVYTAEKTLKEGEGKVDKKVKKTVEEKIEALKKVKDKEDIEAIKKATEELSQELQKIGEAMYKQQSQQAGQDKPGQKPGPDQKSEQGKSDKTVKGEAEEKKKKV